MSNSSRIIKAERELNKAEERLKYSLGITDELVNFLSDLLYDFGGNLGKKQ